MITTKMLENANKIGFFVEHYPDNSLTDIIGLLQLPAIDINTAIWAAEELKFIETPNKETGEMQLGTEKPHVWATGEDVQELEDKILYSFENLEKKETDLEEHYLANWTMGYAAHDLMIAMKRLITTDQVAEYTIEGGEEGVYTFFTLARNREKMWGQSQFKTNPITGEANEDAAEPTTPEEVFESIQPGSTTTETATTTETTNEGTGEQAGPTEEPTNG